MELVDEQDHATLGLFDLLEHGLQAVLELTAELGARHQRAHVELDEITVAQRAGNVARDDALGDALDNGGLAHAGLTDEHRVVLGAAGEDLDGATDLLGAADHRVELAGTRQVADVATVLLKGLELGLGVRRGHAIVTAEFRVHLLDAFARHAGVGQDPTGLALVLGERHEQMLGHHEVVAHLGGLLLRTLEHAREVAAKLLLGALDLGRAGDGLLGGVRKLGGVGADALDDHGNVALPAGEQRRKQMNRLHGAGLRVGRDADGVLQGLPRSHRKLVDSHGITLSRNPFGHHLN